MGPFISKSLLDLMSSNSMWFVLVEERPVLYSVLAHRSGHRSTLLVG